MAEESPGSARAIVVGMTDVGRVREHNEDSFLVMNRSDGRRAGNGERFDTKLDAALLLVVCDGMGGAAAGEVASRMAADRLATELGAADFSSSSPDQIASLMDHAVQQANADIHAAAVANPNQKGMGTTLTAAVVTPGRLYVSQVGDSRAYLLRKGNLNQLTKDQSLIGQLIEEGTLTEEEAEKLGGRNIVLQAVGVEENLRVDTKYWPLLRGDQLLVCSDGLTGMVKDAQVKEILLASPDDLHKAAENLISEANRNGGRDNVTAIVARFDGEGLRAPMEAASEEMEKAGVAFKAPPPPDVPNPMKRMGFVGLVVLAVIAALFFLLQKTTADLQVSTRPAGMPVKLVLTGPGGVRHEAVARDSVAVFEGVKPSDQDFELTASLPGHFDDTRRITIRDPGQLKLDAWPIPMPGTVTIVSKTPLVVVRIEAKGTHDQVKPFDNSYPLPEADEERKLKDVPAGQVKVTATRAGFESWESSQLLEPMASIRFEVPKLAEITGFVVVECTENGAQIEVLDEKGQTLAKDQVRDGQARMRVRVGRQSLRLTKTGFKDYEDYVEVVEGKDTPKVVNLEVTRLQVTLVGPSGAEFKIWKLRPDGTRDTAIAPVDGSANGRSRPQKLEPGQYEIEWQVGNDVKKPVGHVVRVGDKPVDIELKDR